jgi:hypothetical protein
MGHHFGCGNSVYAAFVSAPAPERHEQRGQRRYDYGYNNNSLQHNASFARTQLRMPPFSAVTTLPGHVE